MTLPQRNTALERPTNFYYLMCKLDRAQYQAHYNGNVVSLDATVLVDAKMTILESYQLSEKIERTLRKKFGIVDTDISFIPDPGTFSDKDVKGHF